MQKKEAAKLANKGKPKAKKGKASTDQSPEAFTSTTAEATTSTTAEANTSTTAEATTSSSPEAATSMTPEATVNTIAESDTATSSSVAAHSAADAPVDPDAPVSAHQDSTTHVQTPTVGTLPPQTQENTQPDSVLKQSFSADDSSRSIPADHNAEPAEHAEGSQSEAASNTAVHTDTARLAESAGGVLPAELAGSALPADSAEPAEPSDSALPADRAEPVDSALPAEPADSVEPAGPAGHALPAEPNHVMKELEGLGKLPDMPKVDYPDDLPGLFQAAFATCETQMSPRRAARERPQLVAAEELSLYEDADEALEEEDREGKGSEGVVLDASDEETQQKSGPAARPLLENFVNSSGTVADSNSQVSSPALIHSCCSTWCCLCSFLDTAFAVLYNAVLLFTVLVLIKLVGSSCLQHHVMAASVAIPTTLHTMSYTV